MADPRFFHRAGPFTLGRLAEAVGGDIRGSDPSAQFTDVAPLDRAEAADVSFLDNRQYIEQFRISRAGAAIARPEMAEAAPAGMALILTADPYRAYAKVAALFYPRETGPEGIAPTAVVDPTAVIGAGARIEAGAVVGARAEVGAASVIGPNAVIGAGVIIGDRCTIGANASVSHTIMGRDVHVYPGCRIGQDGFGFAMGPRGHLKVPQLGRVIIGDDVEIGANTTIDRGAGPDTTIGSGCRIDNLVQIGHNVQLGPGCIIVSQVGISGSTKLGQGVVIGGQGGLAGHLTIGDGAQIAAQSGVLRNIAPGEKVMGYPAKPIMEFWREIALLKKLVTRKS